MNYCELFYLIKFNYQSLEGKCEMETGTSGRPKTGLQSTMKDDLMAMIDDALSSIKDDISLLHRKETIDKMLSNLAVKISADIESKIKIEVENQLKSRNDEINKQD